MAHFSNAIDFSGRAIVIYIIAMMIYKTATTIYTVAVTVYIVAMMTYIVAMIVYIAAATIYIAAIAVRSVAKGIYTKAIDFFPKETAVDVQATHSDSRLWLVTTGNFNNSFHTWEVINKDMNARQEADLNMQRTVEQHLDANPTEKHRQCPNIITYLEILVASSWEMLQL